MKHITHYYIYILSLYLGMLFTSCLDNDIPYPRIQPNFVSISAKDEMKSANIDTLTRTVTFYLPEEVNIANVQINSYALSDGASMVGDTISRPFDLSSPKTVTLRLYQDYQWTFVGEQTVERHFTVAGQIGQTTIDVPGRRVVAYVSESTDLTKLKVESIKLGPEGSTMTPDISGQVLDFSRPLNIIVDAYGEKQEWTIYIETTEATVTTERVDAWTNVAWVYGQVESGREVSVEYRLKGDTEWIKAPSEWITVDGGSFYARLIHLSQTSEYEARAVSGEDAGQTITFTTGTKLQLPNSNFDNWWLDGKVWNPWAQNGEKYWDTGNKGATTLGPSNTIPTEDTPTGTGLAAMLQTKFVGIGMLGKLAAGNIFVGEYIRTDGTNGILGFGRPFDLRPTKMKGYLKYKTAPISSVTQGFEDLKGQPDTCIIWIALIDSPEPFEIRTNPNNRNLFNPDGDYVVAYGKIEQSNTIEAYIPFEINLEYKSTSRVPKYILVTASASKYGDYFTGGNGAVLWIDDLELLYDY